MPPLFMFFKLQTNPQLTSFDWHRTSNCWWRNFNQVRCGIRWQSCASRYKLCCHELGCRIHTNCYCCRCIDLVESKARKTIKQVFIIIDYAVCLILIRVNSRSNHVVIPVTDRISVRHRYSLIQLPCGSWNHHCSSNLERLAFWLCQELNIRYTSDGGR